MAGKKVVGKTGLEPLAGPVAKTTKKKAAKAVTAPPVPQPQLQPPMPSPAPTWDEIAARSLALYRAGSRDTMGNWLRAERELMNERA